VSDLSHDPLAALETALHGRRPPEGLAALPADTLDAIADAVHEARDHQAEQLKGALDHALRLAPWPLRGTLKKMLVG
jgi:hypothetical protein